MMFSNKHIYIEDYGICYYYGRESCANPDTFEVRMEPIFTLPNGDYKFFNKSLILKNLTTEKITNNNRRKSLCQFILKNKT